MIVLVKAIAWMATNLAALALILLAAASLGNLVLRKQQFHSWLERIVFATTLGLAFAAVFLFALALAGVLYKGVILVLTVAGALPSILKLRSPQLWRFLRDLGSIVRKPDRSKLLYAGIAIAAVSYWMLLLLLSQYPPLNWDSTAYHLVLAREYLINHRFVVHTGVPVPIVPSLNHLLFSWALAVKNDVLAQMIEHTFLILTAAALFCWGNRLERPALGAAAAGMWLAHPLVLWVSECAYVDVGLVTFVFSGIYALRVFWEHHDASWWLIAMALLAAGAGVKMPGLFFVGIAAGLGLWSSIRSSLTREYLLLGWCVAVVIAAPFYAVIYLHTGNPLWPTLSEISRGAWADPHIAEWNRWITSIGLPKTPVNLVLIPFHVIADPARFVADANRPVLPILLVWPLAWVVAWFDRSVRWWTLWGVLFCVFWFLTSQQLRFLLPALPIIGIALCESGGWLMEKLRCSVRVQNSIWFVVTTVVLLFGARASWSEISLKGVPPIGPLGRDAFLAKVASGYAGVRFINQRAAEDESVYVINGSWLNYYFKPRVIDSNGLLQRQLWPSFRWPQDEQWMGKMQAERVDWIFVHHAGLPPYLKKPDENPAWRPYWPAYKLAYDDASTWVFRRSQGS